MRLQRWKILAVKMNKWIFYRGLVLWGMFFATSSVLNAQPEIIFDKVDPIAIKQFNPVSSSLDLSIQMTSIEDGAVIPGNYFYPLFQWKALGNDGICLLEIHSKNNKLQVLVRGNSWQPDGDQFGRFLKETEIEITIYQVFGENTHRSRTIRVVPARTSITDRIVYRVVEPLFNVAGTNLIKVFSFEERQPGDLVELGGLCLGCHTYSAGVSLFNVKKDKDRRLILCRNADALLKQKLLGEFSFLTISPDGRYAAVVGNISGKITIKPDFIEPFNLPYEAGDIYIYDLKRDTLFPLNGASELDYIEDMPSFSPDGKWILFVRYQFADNEVKPMNIYQVPFNEGRGGAPVPVKNASDNNQYNYFPRFSPDGRWISFCRGNGQQGIFARKSSDIYLLTRDQNRVLKLNFNQDKFMDSWHYWSSDSHWLILSSNRETNQLTSLYLVYIDAKGRDYPPVKLIGYEKKKVNTPQFIPERVNLRSLKKFKDFCQEVFITPGGVYE